MMMMMMMNTGKKGRFYSKGAGWPKISWEKGHPAPTILLLRKLG